MGAFALMGMIYLFSEPKYSMAACGRYYLNCSMSSIKLKNGYTRVNEMVFMKNECSRFRFVSFSLHLIESCSGVRKFRGRGEVRGNGSSILILRARLHTTDRPFRRCFWNLASRISVILMKQG